VLIFQQADIFVHFRIASSALNFIKKTQQFQVLLSVFKWTVLLILEVQA